MLEEKETWVDIYSQYQYFKKEKKVKKKSLLQRKKKELKLPVFLLKKRKEKKNVIFTFYIHNFTLSFFIVSRGYQVAFKYCSVVSSYYRTLSLFFKICMFRIVFSQKHFDHEKSACT